VSKNPREKEGGDREDRNRKGQHGGNDREQGGVEKKVCVSPASAKGNGGRRSLLGISEGDFVHWERGEEKEIGLGCFMMA